MKFDYEKYDELLSSYYSLWMGTKHAVGLAPNWKGAPKPEDNCSGGYSTNREMFNSEKCKKERLTLTKNIEKGWSIQDVMQFVVLLFLPPISVLFTWGWCGNNVLNTTSAAVRGKYLERLFDSAYENPTRQKSIQDIVDQCGTMFLSTDVSLDLPFWYSVRNPPTECLNRESVQITHIKDDNVASAHAFEPKDRNAWLTCMDSRFGGALSCLQSAESGSTNPTRNLVKNGELCPPSTTLYINNQLRQFWLRASQIGNFGAMPGEEKKFGYYANIGSGANGVPGEPIGIFGYLSFWYTQYLIAPLMAFKMSMIGNIYSVFGGCGEDVRVLHEQADVHNGDAMKPLTVDGILKDQEKVGGASFGIPLFGKGFGKETLAFLATPLFPYMFSLVAAIESFYMMVLVVTSFAGNACGRIWPLTAGSFLGPIDTITSFLRKQSLDDSEKETRGWMRFFANLATSISGFASLFLAIVAAVMVTAIFLIVGTVVCMLFGPVLTSFLSMFIYTIGPILGGDSWCSGVTGHFLNITGIAGDKFHPFLFITKYKWLLLVVSLISVLSSQAVTVVLDSTVIGIAWGLLILSLISPTVRKWIGLTTTDAPKDGAKPGSSKSGNSKPGSTAPPAPKGSAHSKAGPASVQAKSPA
jgi:hypothetical protein